MSHTRSGKGVEPYVLFGSSFPKDKEYTQICQNVNQIKLCMETGRTVILLNLENLYESLYDALNQYYIKCFGKRYVDLGLQAHKVKCMVHEDFKLVLIAEKKTVYEKFPIPLISRLEKHYVVTSSVFNDWQNDVLDKLIEWARKFSTLRDYDSSSDFKVEEAFIGYQKDSPAAAIFQATKQCRQMRNMVKLSCQEEGSEYWNNAVLLQSQQLLLHTATPDAVVRLNASFESNYKELQSKYFKNIYCPSLLHYLKDRLSHCNESQGHLMQVTTHSRVLSRSEILEMTESFKVKTEIIFLHQFDTEIDFLNKIRSLFQRKPGTENENVLIIIQCQSGHQYGDLIACARYRVNDERSSSLLLDRTMLVPALLDLIPEAPPVNLDQVPFYGALVKHVHSLLKQMEDIIPQCKKWALNEASSHKSLRHGGTLRNTLIKKIDDTITPFLAYILSFIVQYHNLALYRKHDDNPVSKLWLSIFSDSSIIQFKYTDITKPINESDAVQFECNLPFFWIAKEAIESSIAVMTGTVSGLCKCLWSTLVQDLKECEVLLNRCSCRSLIRLLFDTVFYSRPRDGLCFTRQLSYKEEVDKIPVVRSSLLQLLLKHSFESVREYLQEYFHMSRQILQLQTVDTCLLYLLCIKCFQDVISAKHEHKPLKEQASIASDLLVKCHQHLICPTGEVTFDYLQAVAQCRIGLLIAGECLHESGHVQINASLLNAVKNICTDKHINRISPTEATGPNIFLLKVLARSCNMSALKQVAQKHTWLLPPALHFSEKEPQPDTFVAYGPVYCMVRDRVADAMFGRNLKHFESDDLEVHERIFIILALYEVVTLNHIQRKHQRLAGPPGPEVALAFEKCKVLPTKMQIMAKTLLLCNQDSLFVEMWASSPQSEILSAIVVHTAVAMLSRQGLSMLWPFVTMLSDPASLMNTYLPTMPEDVLPQVRQVLNSQGEPQGQFYECPMGHRYFVGDCGRPMQQAMCPECRAPIGGQNHQPVGNNRAAQQSNGFSQCGYILPLPAQRSSDPIPERKLPPIACCLVRIMMHSVLLWACNIQNISDGVVRLLKGRDTPAAVQLLLQHLRKDFETLQRAVRKSELECAILVHAVLQNILFDGYSGNSPTNQLRSSIERFEWEQTFCDTFISPVLRDMGETVPNALQLIMNDKKEYGRLMYIVNEKLDVKLADLARLEIKDENLIPSFGPDVSLECIVSTTTGAGVCVTALLDFLVRTHNDFLMDCKTKEQGELRKDVHSIQNFSKIKEQLRPQVKLPIQSQQEILGELTSIPQLKEMLDTLETVMAFLTGRSSGHGGDMNLSSYAESLQIKFCSKLVARLFLFISIYIRNAEKHEQETTSISQGMELFRDTYDEDEDIPGFTAHFPSDITLEQAVSAWKLIVEYQNTVEGFKLM
eukprot:Em0001g2837a